MRLPSGTSTCKGHTTNTRPPRASNDARRQRTDADGDAQCAQLSVQSGSHFSGNPHLFCGPEVYISTMVSLYSRLCAAYTRKGSPAIIPKRIIYMSLHCRCGTLHALPFPSRDGRMHLPSCDTQGVKGGACRSSPTCTSPASRSVLPGSAMAVATALSPGPTPDGPALPCVPRDLPQVGRGRHAPQKHRRLRLQRLLAGTPPPRSVRHHRQPSPTDS